MPTPTTLTLTDDELAFFRMTCDLFPTPESPLGYLDEEDAEPEKAEVIFDTLKERGMLNDSNSGAAQHVLDRLVPVSECNARVSLSVHHDTRDFYLTSEGGVEYRRDQTGHVFGPLRSETALAAEIAQKFKTAAAEPARLSMSAGEYLVFAVFARDLRSAPAPEEEASKNGESPMSVDEVLAYFDEAETTVIRTPSDDTWQASIASLASLGVLIEKEDGYHLDEVWHPLARQVVADRQHTVTRFDFLDDQWLMREVSIYPTEVSAYRLGTQPDGSVLIEELSTATLADVLAGVVGTLPNLLNPEAPPTLKHPMLSLR